MEILKYVMVAKTPQLNGNIKLYLCVAIKTISFSLILYLYRTYKFKTTQQLQKKNNSYKK